MIKPDIQHEVICADCQAIAYHREVTCIAPGRMAAKYAYDTHNISLSEAAHTEALNRLDIFVTSLNTLLADANMHIPTLQIGSIKDISASAVNPTACGIRTHFIPLVTIKAFASEEEGECTAVALEGLSVETLLDIIRIKAEAIATNLRQKFEAGNF